MKSCFFIGHHDAKDEVYPALRAEVENLDGELVKETMLAYAKERADFDTAFGIAAILMILTLVINLVAELVGGKLRKK